MARYEPTAKEQAILQKVKAQFEANACSEIYSRWFRNAVEDFLFYDGYQWSAEEIEKAIEFGIELVTVNKTAPRLDNVSGQEVQTRTKVIFRARSADKAEKETSEALSDLAMFVEEKNDSTHILSKVSEDARKCGVGWHEFDVQDGVISEQARNPLEVVFDVRDRSSGMTNQGCLSVMNWMPYEDAEAKFGDKIELLDGGEFGFATGIKDLSDAAQSLRLTSSKSYKDEKTGEICVIEHHWREPTKYYEVVTKDGRLVTTFDKAEADKIARSPKRGEKDITAKDGYKVFIAYFCGNVLLDYNEDFYHLDPRKGRFLLTPTVCFRERVSSIPYGLVRKARDPQRNYNRNRTRLRWLQAAHQVITDGDAKMMEQVRREASRPDGILYTKTGGKLEINRHEQAIAQHLAVLQQDDKDIQDALGIYDEAMGVETNASSGVAIQKRLQGTNRNQASIMDNVRAARKQWGETLLALVQCVFTDEVALWVLDDEEQSQALVLNQVVLDENGKPEKDKNGRPVMKFDIKTGVYDVIVQEIPDVATQTEYARELVLKAVTAVGLQGITPGFLELMGVPKSAKLMEEVTAGLPQQLAAQNSAAEAAPTIADRTGGAAPVPTAMPGGGQPALQPMGQAQ